MNTIISNAISKSITYDTYIEMVSELVENQATTGTDQSESLIDYTKLNFRRMSRLNKTVKLSSDLIGMISDIPIQMKWVVITESWCGDAAQNMPYIAQLAKACSNVDLRVVLRDENLEFMDQYLTNGSRSIPKAVFLKADDLEVLSTWGPRPEVLQKKVMDFKKNPPADMTYEQFSEGIHVWYTKNKNMALESELLSTFQTIKESITK